MGRLLYFSLIALFALSGCGKSKNSSSDADNGGAKVRNIVVRRNGEVAAYYLGNTDHYDDTDALVLVPNLGVIAINTVTGAFVTDLLYFTTTNCTGTPYFSTDGLLKNRIVKGGDGIFYRIDSFQSSISVQSGAGSSGTCSTQLAQNLQPAAVLTPTTAPTSDFSDIAPLELEVE